MNQEQISFKINDSASSINTNLEKEVWIDNKKSGSFKSLPQNSSKKAGKSKDDPNKICKSMRKSNENKKVRQNDRIEEEKVLPSKNQGSDDSMDEDREDDCPLSNSKDTCKESEKCQKHEKELLDSNIHLGWDHSFHIECVRSDKEPNLKAGLGFSMRYPFISWNFELPNLNDPSLESQKSDDNARSKNVVNSTRLKILSNYCLWSYKNWKLISVSNSPEFSCNGWKSSMMNLNKFPMNFESSCAKDNIVNKNPNSNYFSKD